MRMAGGKTAVGFALILLSAIGFFSPASTFADPYKWDVFVASGTGDGQYNHNVTINIAADANTTAQVFSHWVVEPDTYQNLLADDQDPTTTFTTPNQVAPNN